MVLGSKAENDWDINEIVEEPKPKKWSEFS